MKILTGLGLLLFSACQPPREAQSTRAEEPIVTLWHALRGEEYARLQSQLDAYTEKTGQEVRALQLPHNAFANKIQVSIPRGNGPDLFIHAHDRIGDWAEAGLIEPLSYWVTTGDLDDFLVPAVDAFTYRHQLYGLPISCKALALFYRTDLVSQAPQTTEELYQMARSAIAQSGAGLTGQVWGLAYPELDSLYFHAPWLHAYGGPILDEGGAHIDSEGFRESALIVKKLRDEGLIPPEVDGALASELFRSGRLAFLINGPWFVAELGDLKTGARAEGGSALWSVAPLPRSSDTGRSLQPYMSVEGVMISSRARAPKAAWRLARYLTSDEIAAQRLAQGELVARSTPYQARGKRPAWLTAFRAQLEHSLPLSNEPLMKSLWKPAKRALEEIILRGQDPQRSSREAQRSFDRARQIGEER